MNFMHSLLRSPEACGLNRLSSRANLFPFPDFESAKAFKKSASPFVIDLNGTWKFRYLTDPENLTERDFQASAPLDGFEDRMASLLFKLAVETAMMLHVTASNNEIDEEILSELRGLCVNEVKRLHGRISLEDALKFQKG